MGLRAEQLEFVKWNKLELFTLETLVKVLVAQS